MNWNDRCRNSIRKEKKEIEQRYGIKIGMTDIHCAKCGESWGYGKHLCKEVRLTALHKIGKSRLNASCASTEAQTRQKKHFKRDILEKKGGE